MTDRATVHFREKIGSMQGISLEVCSLLLSLDYQKVKYFINHGKEVLCYGAYTLQGVNSDIELAQHLEEILAQDMLLLSSFAQVKVLLHSSYEIVPMPFYSVANYDETTIANDILGGEAKFLFSCSTTIKAALDRLFARYEVHHSGEALISQVSMSGRATSQYLHINISPAEIAVAYFNKEGKLLLYNQYKYLTYQDYIYYLLLVAQEMNINRESAELVLMGDIMEQSKLYEMSYLYFKNITFAPRPSEVQMIGDLCDYPSHFNYLLYNL